jgi:hypothetical protein
LGCKSTWPIRKLIEQVLEGIAELSSAKMEAFGRCIALRTGQWALDCRSHVPTASEFQKRFLAYSNTMTRGAALFSDSVSRAAQKNGDMPQVQCLNLSAMEITLQLVLAQVGQIPKLILTSPPYPGVHVLYHRWQVRGRRETPAPFWIAGGQDGNGASFYTFGDRQEKNLTKYFENCLEAFRSIGRVADRQTIVVQMVAFSEPREQLQKYLGVMEEAGFVECKMPHLSNARDGRVWRTVPNRKWYTSQNVPSGSCSEVVLFHRKA